MNGDEGANASTDPHRWSHTSGLTQIIGECRQPVYGTNGSTVEIPAGLLRDLQQAALYLHQQMTHRVDLESLQADLRRVGNDSTRIKLDADRKIHDSYEWGRAALTLAAKAGVTDQEVQAQIAYDRDLWALATKREEELTKSRSALLAWMRDLRRNPPDTLVTVGQILASLDKVADGTKTTLQIKARPAEVPAQPAHPEVLFDVAPTPQPSVAPPPPERRRTPRVRTATTAGGRL